MVKVLVWGRGFPGSYYVIITQGTKKQPHTGQQWIKGIRKDNGPRSKQGLVNPNLRI